MKHIENGRFILGTENLKRIDGESGARVIKALNDIAPDLGNYIIEFAFGDIYSRKALSVYEREMITLASLLTLGGCEKQLKLHINGALNVGFNKEKIIETFIQCLPYAGFPRVLNAVFTAKELFESKS